MLIWLELENSDQEEWQRRLERQVFAKISQPTPVQQSSRILYRVIPYAAAILLFAIAGGLYFNYLGKERQTLESREIVQNIAPGGNKATIYWGIPQSVITANTLGKINQNQGYQGAENNVPPLETIEGQ